MSEFSGASDFDEVEVLYDWAPETPEDLRLVAGEIVRVLAAHEHGWWQGEVTRGEGVTRGYFPRNYVKPLPRRSIPAPPPRPESLSPNVSDSVDAVANDLSAATLDSDADRIPVEATTIGGRPAPTNPRPHRVHSLAAFDELMIKGFVLESTDRRLLSASAAGAKGASIGDVVTFKVTACCWDGAYSDAAEFCSGEVCFVVGQYQVIPGLEAAAVLLTAGTSGVITCAPPMAYGAAGLPPHVPPNSHVVCFIEAVSYRTPTDGTTVEASGPTELMRSTVSSSRQGRAAESTQKKSLVLVNGSS